MATANDLTLLERRRIEAGVLVPMIRAFQAEFGEERVNEIVGRTIRDIARKQGEAERERLGVTSLEDVGKRAGQVLADGSWEMEVLEQAPERFAFDVKVCRFVEMYEELGARDLGFLLSCNRDFAYFEGLAPDVAFDRTQTRMEGAAHCDFRYRA